MYRLANSEDVKRFLQGLTLHIDEKVVRQVTDVLTGNSRQSLYSLYAMRPNKPNPICGKGTVDKIKKLYAEGKLQPYLDYLSGPIPLNEAKTEQIEEADHSIETPGMAPARTEQQAPKEIITVIVSKIWELLETKSSSLIADAEFRGWGAQYQSYDFNKVAISRKLALAEVIQEAVADVASSDIYSVTGLQARILKSKTGQRTEFLRESLGDLHLTPADEETLAEALANGALAEKLRRNAEALYHRIKALERHHNPLTTSDVVLISTAAQMNNDQFNKVLRAPSYNEEPDRNADIVSAATKLLLDVGEQQVLLDEVEKDIRMGSTKEAATSTARGRMELAKRLAASWLPIFIRAFAQRLVNESKLSTGWVRSENG